jgi:16S rRNA (cytidine1402-2'-O)-methyltransferase
LLKHYGIKTKVMSYREANAERVIPAVVNLITSGSRVALVAEAGTPGVSDPGRRLIAAARSAGARIIPIPGPSAVVAAVSLTGSDEARFAFEGFLPRRTSKRKQRLREIVSERRQLVFFEAPHRLLESLTDMKAVLGDRRCLVGREITKIHEDITTGRISEFIDLYTRKPPRGEFVIVCEGSAGGEQMAPPESVCAEAMRLVRKGMRRKEAARVIAERYGFKTKEIYNLIVEDHGEGGHDGS